MKCDDRILKNLLGDVELTGEADVASHITGCSRCQGRLIELAADEDSWSEAASALRDNQYTSSVVIAVDAELPSDIPVQADRVTLDFLSQPSHPELLGRIGRYDVERLIGAGGMGIVFKAYDTELHRTVAIKVLAPHLAHSGGARQRFAREAQSAAAVVHENVVPIHNVEAAEKLPFLVMQFVAGESLQSRVDREGRLSTDEVLRIGAQVARGLAAAHQQGLVHRDVKPGNVLLEGQIDRVLISDFGLARAADDASVTRSGVIAGTPHYMSPEQARGHAIDMQSDLFGLGSVLYFMCAAHPPFRADGAMAVLHRICNEAHRPIDEVNDQVPAALADLIDQLLEKNPARRPLTADHVATRLTSYLQDCRTRSITRRQRRQRTRTNRWRLKLVAGAIVLGLLVWGFLAPPVDFGAAQGEKAAPAVGSTAAVKAEGLSDDEVQVDNTSVATEVASPVDSTLSSTSELDALRDNQIEIEFERMTVEIGMLDPPPTEMDSTLPLAAHGWFDALHLATEIATAIESGADEVDYAPSPQLGPVDDLDRPRIPKERY